MSNELFLEPKTTQYGSHMIMSNVNKPLKTKYININTKFGDDYDYSQDSNYNITLPEKITNVTSMRVVSAEIPMSYYNISQALGNNYFYITDVNNNFTKKVIVNDNLYTIPTLITAINASITAVSSGSNIQYIQTSIDPNNSKILKFGTNANVSNSGTTSDMKFILNFSKIDISGNTYSKFDFKYRLGWLLGFRNPVITFTVPAGTKSSIIILTPEASADIYGPKYLYLAIEEFNKGNQSSFVTPLYKSLLNKNIIARITMNRNGGFDYGTVLPANNFNGLLMSDTRSYTGKIDLMKLNTQLLTEDGIVVNLNGIDYSFCLEVTHE